MGDVQSKLRIKREWILFLTAAAVLVVCCMVGGFMEHPGKLFLTIAGWKLPAGKFILLYCLTWGVCVLLFFFFPAAGTPSIKKRLFILLAISLFTRALLFPHAPSDDVNRYLWEGVLLDAGVNPYELAPADPHVRDLAQGYRFHKDINHPDISAAYPPMMLYLFSVAGRVSLTPGCIKIVMVLFDMGAVLFLFLVLEHRRIDSRWTILYALNPLVLYAFAGQGHFDSIQNFFLLAAVWIHDRKYWPLMFIAAGLAVQVKYVAVVALPFFVTRENLKHAPVLLIPVLVPYLPFVLNGGEHLFTGIRTFGGDFAFNGLIHGIVRACFGGIGPATLICKTAFIIVFGYGVIRIKTGGWNNTGDDPVRGIYFAFCALLLLSPTIHFWYLTWILPFAVVRNSVSWVVLSLSVSLYFIANGIMHHTGEWKLPAIAQVLEWLPFVFFFIVESRFYVKRLQADVPGKEVKTVSVVIPACNEEKVIGKCIEYILRDPSVSEIIVVDGGSDDATREAASSAGATVLEHRALPENGGGRGGQIVTGLRAATGDVVAVVHADTNVVTPVFSTMVQVLNRHRDIAGGGSGAVFDAVSLRMRFIELLNGIRSVFFGIHFGDQIQFFRREPVVNGNLFPDIPLMEDVEFSYRLPEAGRCVFLFGDSVVSSRRWRNSGVRNFFTVLVFFGRYVLQRLWKRPDAVAMYYNYYKK